MRGVGCFKKKIKHFRTVSSFRPLSGCKVFQMKVYKGTGKDMFSSPCEVWVVSCNPRSAGYCDLFPSPYGVWVVSLGGLVAISSLFASVPLRGVGCFLRRIAEALERIGFRPLTGCKVFHGLRANRD